MQVGPETVLVLFSTIQSDFISNVQHNFDALGSMAKKNPHMAYSKVNELALFTGSRHGVNMQLHFPDPKKITDVGSYGTENIGIVVDKFRKTFPISRDTVKQQASEILGDIDAQDAYMYEGKEGVKVMLKEGRIEILPGSIHFWCKIDEKVRAYADWLMQNVYFPD